jgi:hypothetical protein
MSDFNDIHKENGLDAVKYQIDRAQNVNDWDDPDMRPIKGFKADINPFPVDYFAPAVEEWVVKTAESKSAPVDYVIAGLLTCVSGLICNSIKIEAWDGWIEPAILWGCCVGLPSSGKTPAISGALDLLYDLETKINPDFDQKMQDYEHLKSIAKEYRKDHEKQIATAVKGGKKTLPAQLPPLAIEPEMPIKNRLIINDATVEIIAPLLSKNPKGIVLFRDELAGWLNSMNQYKGGGGADRAFYLESYNGKPYKVDRVKLGIQGTIEVDRLSIPIIGGIQPDRLVEAILSDADDGMSARLLYYYPHPIPPKRPLHKVNDQIIHDLFQKLYDIKNDEQPHIIPLEERAKKLLEDFNNKVYEMEQTAHGHFLSYIGKNKGRALRLALIIEIIKYAASNASALPESISHDSLFYAISIINTYFNPMAEYAFREAALAPTIRNACIIAKYIKRENLKHINVRNIKHARLSKYLGNEDIDEAIEELVQYHWIKIDLNGLNTNGRPRKDYFVNPKIWRNS